MLLVGSAVIRGGAASRWGSILAIILNQATKYFLLKLLYSVHFSQNIHICTAPLPISDSCNSNDPPPWPGPHCAVCRHKLLTFATSQQLATPPKLLVLAFPRPIDTLASKPASTFHCTNRSFGKPGALETRHRIPCQATPAPSEYSVLFPVIIIATASPFFA